MSWGKAFADVWNTATSAARAATSRAMDSMAAAADLAVDIAKAAKSTATELVNRGVDAARAIRDKVADTYNAIKERFSLWQAANAPTQACSATSRKLGDLDCSELAQEKAALAEAQTKAKLASAVYQNPEQQSLPDGWSRATDDDLRNLGLMDSQGRKLTEIPDSDFRADVFKGPDGRYVVAFKGTTPTSLEDWKSNIQQGMGNPTAYYTRALRIADQIHANQPDNVEYVGHSLGGGLASAAAAKYGSPATTFNAAGLHDKTLLRTGIVPNPDNIDAYYVEGDILSTLQDNSFGMAPKAAGERIPLSPADSITWGDVKAGVIVGALASPVFGVVAAKGARGVRLHGMDSVEDALAKRMGQIDLLRKYKGCE
jgi:hypothetical protein